jgi:predicted secreted protein
MFDVRAEARTLHLKPVPSARSSFRSLEVRTVHLKAVPIIGSTWSSDDETTAGRLHCGPVGCIFLVRAGTSARFPLSERKLTMKSARIRLRLDPAIRLLLLVSLALVMHSHEAFAGVRVVADADKGSSVQLTVGEYLDVHLKSNPTTGYMWYVDPKSTPLLKLIAQSQTQASQPGVGRPISQIFRFRAVSVGEGVLLLHYVRSWEKPVSGEEQFDLHVSIR